MTRDPLAELFALLDRDGAVPLAWVATHAPDGDLTPLCRACTDVRAMHRVLGLAWGWLGIHERAAATSCHDEHSDDFVFRYRARPDVALRVPARVLLGVPAPELCAAVRSAAPTPPLTLEQLLAAHRAW